MVKAILLYCRGHIHKDVRGANLQLGETSRYQNDKHTFSFSQHLAILRFD